MLLMASVGEHAVFHAARRLIRDQALPRPIRRDVDATLDAGRPGPLAFIYEAGMEAGLRHEAAVARGAAIYLLACAVNLADDLTDGECNYLPDASRQGACIEAVLHHLSFRALLEAGIAAPVLVAASADLIGAAGAQRIDLGAGGARASRFRAIADGIGGCLFTAYLRILWTGTRLAPRAPRVARHLGRLIVTWEDVSSRDRRYEALSTSQRRAVLRWALDAAAALRRERLRCLDRLLPGVAPELARQVRALSAVRGQRPRAQRR